MTQRYRTRATGTLVALAFLAIHPGCLKMDQTVTINPDATVDYRLDYSVSEEAITRFRAMVTLRTQLESMGKASPAPTESDYVSALLNPDDAAIRRAIESYSGQGITLERLKLENRNAWRTLQVKVKITDLAKASQTAFFRQHGFTLSRTGADGYLLTRAPESGTEPVPELTDPNEIKQITPLLSGFRMNLTVNVPGRITQSNAGAASGSTAQYAFDFDKDPNALAHLQNQSVRIAFQAPDVQLPEIRTAPEPIGTGIPAGGPKPGKPTSDKR
jgi:hypothetical protein